MLKGICTLSRNAAGPGLTSSVLTPQPLAPSQPTEFFIQSLKQSQLHSNCLSFDFSLSRPLYHPCSSFPCLLHPSFSSTPALHLPNTNQSRTNFHAPPTQASAGKNFLFTEPSPWHPCSFQSLPIVQSLESAVRILHGSYLFQPPTGLCQHVHDRPVNQGIQQGPEPWLLFVLPKCSLC